MQQSNQPARFLIPLAQNDTSRAAIPTTTADPARASQELGFPPLTGQPPEAGGVPPQLPDMNGLLHMASRVGWWNIAGGRYAFDLAYATNALIGGYPLAALIPAATPPAGTAGFGDWCSLIENNVTDPDTVGTGWAPGYHYGRTVLSALTGGTVTLTPAQAAKRTITLNGVLTSNLVLVVPAWFYDWTFVNSTSGAFSVTVRTAAGSGAAVPQNGAPTPVRCDGVNCTLLAANIGPATSPGQAIQLGQATGRLLNVQRFTASGTYTPTTGTQRIVVLIVGGGGGGGGNGPTGAGQTGCGGGGGGGGGAQALFSVPPAPVAVTIGIGGNGGVGASTAPTAGGSSSFGTLVADGGSGAAAGIVSTSFLASPGIGGGRPTVSGAIAVLTVTQGANGSPGISLSGSVVGGGGGSSLAGANGSTSAQVNADPNSGAGGNGAAAGQNQTATTGGNGGSGVCVVYEYA